MDKITSKIAAILAIIIGAMAIFSGGQVILGKIKDYYVIDWLPVYNFSVGLISVFFTAIAIWKNNKYALPATAATLGLHTLVMLVLQTAFRSVVAPDSIRAMTLRIGVWVVILILMLVQMRKSKAQELVQKHSVTD